MALTFLAVTRVYTPIEDDGQWERLPYEEAVWTLAAGSSQPDLHAHSIPTGYTRGLLRTYYRGQPCTLDVFDQQLETAGFTRNDLLQGIRSAE